MKDEYQQWIEDYKKRNPILLGACHAATAEMKEAFPELTVVRGYVYCAWGKRGHLWLTTDDGTIVDPTAEQFPGVFEYEPWVPGSEVRIGTCMNCGDEIWESFQSLDDVVEKDICSAGCYDAFARSLG